MAISFGCPCGKRLRARDELAGKRAKCPACGQVLVIPSPAHPSEAETEPEPQQPAEKPLRKPPVAPPDVRAAALDVSRYRHLLAEKPGTPLGQFLYWGLLLTLIPLAFSLLRKDDDSTEERFRRTMENAPPEVQVRVVRALQAGEHDEVSVQDLIAALPGKRIEGAHLPLGTWMHWLYGVLAATAFFAVILFLLPSEDSPPQHLLGIGLFTATAGIALLFAFQLFAQWTQGRILIARNPVILVLYWIAWAIGFSYQAALNPDYNFFVSLLGYTFGVGLCEEACKALPLIFYYRTAGRLSWRAALSWGFASGIGFGVAEGIMYSSQQYNGIASGGTYLVRFVSCVALHAIWSASVGVFIYKHQNLLQGDLAWHDYIPRVLVLVSVPMILHGLYDTMLKKEFNGGALIVALASFAWLAYQIESARRTGEEPSKRPASRYA